MPSGPRALVVDDNADARDILTEFLTLYGFEVETAKEGLEAVEKAGTWKPDAVVLDLTLPELDGFEVARRLKAAPETRAIPILAYTAFSDPERRARAEEVGCAALLTKPTPPRTLIAALRELLPPAKGPGSSSAEPDPDDTWSRLREVRRTYRAALPSRVGQLSRAWRTLRSGAELDPARLEILRVQAQRLVGSGLMYGLTEVSRSAGRLEQALSACASHGRREERARVDRRLEELERSLTREGGGDDPAAEERVAAE